MAAYDLPPLEGARLAVEQINANEAFSDVRSSSSTAMVGPTRRRSAT